MSSITERACLCPLPSIHIETTNYCTLIITTGHTAKNKKSIVFVKYRSTVDGNIERVVSFSSPLVCFEVVNLGLDTLWNLTTNSENMF